MSSFLFFFGRVGTSAAAPFRAVGALHARLSGSVLRTSASLRLASHSGRLTRGLRFLMFVVLSMSVTLMSCGDPQMAKAKTLEKEVNDLHDESMKEWDKIFPVQKKLKAEIHSLDSVAVLDALSALDRADKTMMDWMNAYDPKSLDRGAEKAITYLEAEKEKVVKMKSQIVSAVEKATQVSTSSH